LKILKDIYVVYCDFNFLTIYNKKCIVMEKDKVNDKLNNIFDDFLTQENVKNVNNNDSIVITQDKGLIERIQKKIITADGRQLLRESGL
jgi:rRNA-processing protein FCF1